MKMVKLFFAFAFAVLLFSCKGGENIMTLLSDPEVNITELITVRYSNEQLEQIRIFDGNINELNDKYPIQCLRRVDAAYSIVFLSEERILMAIYDDRGNKLFCNIFNLSKEVAAFEHINIGDTIEKVKNVDPLGEYLFLYTGRNDIPHNSKHYTSDGFCIQISYDENNVVTSIDKYRI